MTKQVIKYRRVSTEEQATGMAVSLDQQDKEMDALIERMGWCVLAEFEDSKNYVATKRPNKGRVVNPSAKRDDRPGFLAMLELVKTGKADAILCWNDDRLYRHERVVTALKDAIEQGEEQRNGREIEVWSSTAKITKDFMYLQAMIWRKDNEARAARARMGKIGTLQQGRWPAPYKRLGYKSIREAGKRGRKIVLGDDQEVLAVKRIFELCDSGHSLKSIRRVLIASDIEQRSENTKHRWDISFISQILHSRDYTGEAIYCFGDGAEYTVKIPQIIDPDLFKRCQKRLVQNQSTCTRNAKDVYLLQGILRCGECRGTTRARAHKTSHRYTCTKAENFPDEPHPSKYRWGGRTLDYRVWRYLVDQCIHRPDMIEEQVIAKRAELQAQGDDLTSEITRAQGKLTEIDQERAFYQRQAARGKMTEQEFDARMDETEQQRAYWLAEIERLKDLRDNARKIDAGLDYAKAFLATVSEGIDDLDMTPTELNRLSREERNEVLRGRRKIVLALCETIYVYADDSIKIEGALDGGEAGKFGLVNSLPRSSARPGRSPARHWV